MEASNPDVEMVDSPGSPASLTSSPAISEQAGALLSFDEGSDPMHLFSMPEVAYDSLAAKLTAPPSGDATAHPNNNATPRPQNQQFDPRALLNPKSAPKRPASSGGEADRGRADPTMAGQLALVERLHNVQERTSSPAKRIKTDEDRKKAPNGAGFGGGSALDLQSQNGHVPASAPASVQPGPAIDLTMSKIGGSSTHSCANQNTGDDEKEDEDEFEVVGDNSNEVICIGSVKHAYIQAHVVPFPDPNRYLGNSGQQARIKVSFRRSGAARNTAIMVTDATSREFGKVDVKTANALCPLIDGAKTNEMRWVATTEPRKKTPNEGPPGSPFTGLIGMSLQLYCPRKFAHGIGKYLKAKNVFLVRPKHDVKNFDYYNPQDGDSLTRLQALSDEFDPVAFYQQAPQSGVSGGATAIRSVDEIRTDVANVFDTVINHTGDIPTREPSTHIKTELYPHQKQALYFMWDKEQDHSAPEYDDRKDALWQPTYRDNGQKLFRHVITGEEKLAKPQVCRGGILADEMGLGKTLSILSLVADDDSIAKASAFTNLRPSPKPSQSNQIQPSINSKATLLVCPLSTMTNWKEQIKEHFPAGKSVLKWTRYHGSERFAITAAELASYDIVITTYHIIAKDINDRKRALPHINWFRIVLDEAHTIRNPTAQSRATCALFGQRRWAVTGTPVQNRLEDLGALFNFIKLAPFHSPQGFNSLIVQPFKNADPEIVPKLQLLVSTVTMRRTKEIIKDEVPKRNDWVIKLEFSKEERQLHDWFEADTQRKVTAVTSGDKIGGNTYARILTAILNMRLICAHGRDLLSDDALKTTDGMTYDNPMEIGEEDNEPPVLTRQQAYEMLDLLGQTDNDECVFCNGGSRKKRSVLDMDSDDEDDDEDVAEVFGYMTPCYHIICPKHVAKLRQQWKDTLMADGNVQCMICEDRGRPAAFEMKRSDYREYQNEQERMRKDPKLSKKINSYNGPHTKTKALLYDLDEFRQWSVENPDERPIKR
jgi:hypothetical protein